MLIHLEQRFLIPKPANYFQESLEMPQTTTWEAPKTDRIAATAATAGMAATEQNRTPKTETFPACFERFEFFRGEASLRFSPVALPFHGFSRLDPSPGVP
jgi:hypothetical protein